MGSVVVVMLSGGEMVIARGLICVCAVGVVLSVARIEKRKVPAVVGTPDSVPSGWRVSPAGGAPDASVKLYGAVPPAA